MKTKFIHVAIALFMFVSSTVFAQQSAVFAPDQQAIRGYDPVAYFTANMPVKGSPDFTYVWQDVTWSFASQANLDAFKTNPDKYAPQYGGYCAYGLSESHKSPTDPAAFTIVNDKLYLNYNPKVKTLWSKDQPARIKTADAKWPALKTAKAE